VVVRRFTVIDSQGRLQTFRAYDPVDRLTRVTTPTGEVFTQSYDLAGRMLGRIAPNSTATDRSYEAQTGRLAEQTQSASDTLFNGFTYDYTDRGNIAEIAETGTLARTKRYSYDELEPRMRPIRSIRKATGLRLSSRTLTKPMWPTA